MAWSIGLRYVDHVLWEPGLWLLVALSLVAAAICLANLRTARTQAAGGRGDRAVRSGDLAQPAPAGNRKALCQARRAASREAIPRAQYRTDPDGLSSRQRRCAAVRRQGNAHASLARTRRTHGQQYPAMGSAPAARDLPPVAGNPALLRFSGRGYRPLLDQRQIHRGDALAARAQHFDCCPTTLRPGSTAISSSPTAADSR